ncbi:hypothetical protein CEXT_232981 [Caerostris extrusa]|uniref:Uncharacterized protein n=1 Tax=Caerostris extrusa TaxID=172846 RepID=A0AAV4VM50_CAEEX|nr:hypothetical protein CEXT_232981 [Caerostris extrusa]
MLLDEQKYLQWKDTETKFYFAKSGPFHSFKVRVSLPRRNRKLGGSVGWAKGVDEDTRSFREADSPNSLDSSEMGANLSPSSSTDLDRSGERIGWPSPLLIDKVIIDARQ